MCISETRLRDDSLTNISTPNYNFVHTDSITNGVVGGVTVYTSSNYNFELDLKLDMKVNGCDEEIWLNLKRDVIPSKQITIGTVYRHPYTNSNYIKVLQEPSLML